MSQISNAVFISYASQDAPVAEQLADLIRRAGVEVWLDTDALRGGDAWDRHIQEQIQRCTLFVALISSNTEARLEGYFRREWRMAAERTRDIADDQPFLLPVAIDDVSERSSRVPDAFRRIQWSPLKTAEDSAALVARITALITVSLTGTDLNGANLRSPSPEQPLRIANASSPRRLVLAILLVAAGGLVIVVALYLRLGPTSPRPMAYDAPASEKSLAVLPFSDLSEKKDQEFLADGLSEDLIAMLSKVPDLRVPGRTSSFFFKGKSLQTADMASQLGVANLLVGTVRRSAQRLRITAQLIQAASGRTLWSESYERSQEDVLQIQDDITLAITQALRIALRNALPKSFSGSHFNAYKLLLEGRFLSQHGTASDSDRALSAFRGALELDPAYAPAWAALSNELLEQADNYGKEVTSTYSEARSAAKRAIEIEPKLVDGYVALANILIQYDWDWAQAQATAETARGHEPLNLAVLGELAYIDNTLGNWDSARERIQKTISRDPLNASMHGQLGSNLYCGKRYKESEAEFRKAIGLAPDKGFVRAMLARALMQQRRFNEAVEEGKKEPNLEYRLWSLAMVYNSAGRKAEADSTLAMLKHEFPHGDESGIGWVYAERGEPDQAFDWFERAYQIRDVGILFLKCIPEASPKVVQDLRFRDLLRKLNLPTD